MKAVLYPAHAFVLHDGISEFMARHSVAGKDHVTSLKVKVAIQTDVV